MNHFNMYVCLVQSENSVNASYLLYNLFADLELMAPMNNKSRHCLQLPLKFDKPGSTLTHT